MFNLIKMNFYRLFHQRSFYVVIGTALFISWFMVHIVWMVPRMAERAAENLSQTNAEEETGFHVGIVTGGMEGAEAPVTDEFNLLEFMDEYFTSGIIVILISVGASMIANSERKKGFIKNLGGQIKPRGMLVGTKLPVMLFEILIILAATVLGFALFGQFYFDKYTAGSLTALCRVLSVQLLLCLAFGALILLVCAVTRNAVAGIIVGIVMSSGMLLSLYRLFNQFAAAYLGAGESFDISRYTLSYYLMGITSAAGSGDMTAAGLAGAVYLLLAAVIGSLVTEKRDI